MADFLYWRAENHGFSYAYETDANKNIGSIIRIDPEWDPAFRLGLGWNTTYDFWDVFFNYTWFRNKSNETRTSNNLFIPMWPMSGTSGTFSSVSAKSKFQLDIGDLELGRMLFLTKTVAIRPHWGIRGGTLHQKFNNSFVDAASQSSEQRFTGKNNYWGIGPRTGVNGEFHLNEGFSLKGILSGALLYGKNKASAKTSQPIIGSPEIMIMYYSDDFYQLVPHAQLALGFQWQTCFWCEKMLFRMSAMWETNYWWNQFNLPIWPEGNKTPLPTVGNQPLTMEGLTVNFEWGF